MKMQKILALFSLCALISCTSEKETPMPVLSIEGGQVQGVSADIDGVVVYLCKYSNPNGADDGEWQPFTQDNQNFMVFKLNEAEAEASEMGTPLTAN